MIFAYDKDRIYFSHSYDSLYEQEYYFNPIEENLPCWHPHEGMLIYVNTNRPRIVDLIRYFVNIPTELSFESLNGFYEDIWSTLREHGYTNDAAYRLDVTIANAHEAYYLSKLGITDRDDKQTTVSGGMSPELAAGISRDLSPIERIKAYYRLENSFFGRKDLPILLLSTDEPGVKLVDL